MKTTIIYDPIPYVETNKDFDELVVSALLLSLKEKGLITHCQYDVCLKKLNPESLNGRKG